MLRLYLVRHAKSSWDNINLNDFDRPLNGRGQNDAPRMGKHLNESKIYPEIMIASPAARALATAVEIATALGYPRDKIKTDRRIYHAEPNQLLEVIKEVTNVRSLMIFGHNPGLTDFANRLLGSDIDNIPTCGVIGAHLNIEAWSELAWQCGDIDFFDYPKREH